MKKHTIKPFCFVLTSPYFEICLENSVGSKPLYDKKVIDQIAEERDNLIFTCEKVINRLQKITKTMSCDEQGIGPDCKYIFQSIIDLSAAIKMK